MRGVVGGELSYDRLVRVLTALVACAFLAACGGDGAEPAPLPPGPQLEGECAPGTRPIDAGGCQLAGADAGVPASACAAGFVAEDGGCVAVQPAADCPSGLMAALGETACRAVSPCVSGAWGDIPVDAQTQFVDGSYVGGNSDGSQTAPWTSVSQALGQAVAGAIIAIAAGDYEESVTIQKPVVLWGVCPELVTLRGVTGGAYALRARLVDVEIRGLGISGPTVGVVAEAGSTVLLERVWLHDLDDIGAVSAESSTLRVTDSLVERSSTAGVLVTGAAGAFVGSTIRETRIASGGQLGVGIVAQPNAGNSSTVSVERCILVDSRGAGIGADSSEVTVSESLLRDNRPLVSGEGGSGIDVRAEQLGPSTLSLARSVIEDSVTAGVLCDASEALIEDTSIRRLELPPDLAYPGGWGIAAHTTSAAVAPAVVTVRRSLVEQVANVSILARSSELTVEDTLVRDCTDPGDLDAGRGIEAAPNDGAQTAAAATIRGSRVERCYGSGIEIAGSHGVIESTLVRDIRPYGDGMFGRGIQLTTSQTTLAPGSGEVRWSVIEDTRSAIFVAGANVLVDATAVTGVDVNANGEQGVGIQVQLAVETGAASTATIHACAITDAAAAGVLVAGADADVVDSVVSLSRGESSGVAGDGIAYIVYPPHRSSGRIERCSVSDNHRGGVTSFGAEVTMADTEILCNPVDINGEPSGPFQPSFYDEGNNACGCNDERHPCVQRSSGLAPPGVE